jgi:uncharacterized 2Fe-2S/4Fe-4S cluster protein (DUF4445 family)
MSHEPLAFALDVALKPPSPEDRTADAERLKFALKEAGLGQVVVPLDILRTLPEKLRKNSFSMTVVIGCIEKGLKVLDIREGDIFGIALDIGTTTIECVVYDLSKKMRLAAGEVENPQIRYGADVLSRMQAAMSGEGARLSLELLEGINSLIRDVCSGINISPQDVYALTVSGNAIMSHFFLNLDVRNIPISPNITAVSSPVFCSALEAGVSAHPNAVVYVFPNAGGYVGGDIISGMLSANIHKHKEPVLFMDVGTNVEVALGCRDWIMVGAGAAGPALEGGVADIGIKAEKGTISRVEIDRLTKEPRLTVISGGEPCGICGSGLIDLVSELFSNAVIDQAGRFNAADKRVIKRNEEPVYLLYASDSRELLFRERELQNFLRSKAAMFAFLYVFLRSVGLKFSDIGKIFLSGALGCGINLDSAVNIGMLPDIRRDRIAPLGNSSLAGASMVLTDSSLLGDVEKVVSLVTYREMSEDTDLLNILQGALFIPHTDPDILKE